MTEKRFTLEEFGLNFIVNDNGRNLTAKQTVDRLNELNDENEQLKSENQRVSEQKYIYKQDWKHLCIVKELLDSENEQLKQKIKSIKEILNEDIGYIESLRKIEEVLK